VDVETSLASLPADLPVRWLLLSVGGNDLLAGELNNFEERFGQFFERLRKGFPQAHLAVLNTYDPTDGTGLVQSSRDRGSAATLGNCRRSIPIETRS